MQASAKSPLERKTISFCKTQSIDFKKRKNVRDDHLSVAGDYDNYVIQCDVVNSLLKAAKFIYSGNIIKNSKHDQRGSCSDSL